MKHKINNEIFAKIWSYTYFFERVTLVVKLLRPDGANILK